MGRTIRTYLGVALILAPLSLFSQASFKGEVKAGNEPLPYAQVSIQGGALGTIANPNGYFEIKDIPAGWLVFEIRAIGYKPFADSVWLTDGQVYSKVFALSPDVFGLEQVVVSASRNEQNRGQAALRVDVINQRQLEQVNAWSVSDGLKYSPGLRMETNCQNCGFSQVRINGLSGTYSQILINGRPTFSALNSIYGLEQIPADMLDRIEVIKGGGSALYGSSAIGGTINVITKEPVRNSYSIQSQGAVMNQKSAAYNLGFYTTRMSKSYDSGLSVFGNFRSRESYDRDGDGYSEIPRLQNLGLGTRAFKRLGKRVKLSLNLYGLQEYRRGGNLLDLEPHEADVAEELKSQVGGGELSLDQWSKDRKSRWNAFFSAQYTHMDNYYGAGKDPNGYGQTTDFSLVSGLQYSRKTKGPFIGKGELTAGLEYKWDDMSDEKPGYDVYIDQTINTLGAYLQYDWKVSGVFKVKAGGRLDAFQPNQYNASPMISAKYTLSPGLELRGSYSRGFRIPQLFSEEVHTVLVSGEIRVIRLEEGLKAEQSDSYTLSLDFDKDWSGGQVELIVEGFYTRVHNPFILEDASSEYNQNVLEKRNGPGATVQGINLEAGITNGTFYTLEATFTMLRSRYDEVLQWSEEVSDDQLTRSFLRTPDRYGSLIASFTGLKNMDLSASLIYTGPMWVQHYAGYVESDRLERTSDFLEMGLKASYTFDLKKNKLIISAGVNNLLDSFQDDFDRGPNRDAGYVYGPQQPRTYFIGVRLHN